MKKVLVTWIGTGKTGLHNYIRVQYDVDGFIIGRFVEVTPDKASKLAVGEEIEVPTQLLESK